MVFLVLLPKCPPYQSKRKKKKEGQHSRKSSPEEEATHLQKQKMRSPCALRDPSPKSMRWLLYFFLKDWKKPPETTLKINFIWPASCILHKHNIFILTPILYSTGYIYKYFTLSNWFFSNVSQEYLPVFLFFLLTGKWKLSTDPTSVLPFSTATKMEHGWRSELQRRRWASGKENKSMETKCAGLKYK